MPLNAPSGSCTHVSEPMVACCESALPLKASLTGTAGELRRSLTADDTASCPVAADLQHQRPPGGAGCTYRSDTLNATGCVEEGEDFQREPSVPHGRLGQLAAIGQGQEIFEALAALDRGVFVTGGPGDGKSTILRNFCKAPRVQWPRQAEVVIVAPIGSAAKTAEGQTYQSFFGFTRGYDVEHADPVIEATRLMRENKYRVIARRLAAVRVLLLNEVSIGSAALFDVMCELLRHSRPETSPPCQVFKFCDFLQLVPKGGGALAFISCSWRHLYGNSMLELTVVHRQRDASIVSAIQNARYGVCSPAVESLMADCAVTQEQYKNLKCSVLHLMPPHEDV